jgi:putative DNA methylase
LIPAPNEIDADRESRFFESLCAWNGPASTIAEARKQVVAASGGQALNVLDCFAGGGAIPLEAARLGCNATAIELNPVAHLVELCTLDFPQRFGSSLASDVRKWGEWLIARAWDEIGDLYPELADDGPHQRALDGDDSDRGRVPVAYLWTRTVPCPNKGMGKHRVPLVRQTWLVKKRGRAVALRPIPDRATLTVSWEVVEASGRDELGFDPEKGSSGGGADCLICGAAVSADYAREAGRTNKYEQELLAVALVRAGTRG